MLLSELIDELESVKESHGDLPVVFTTHFGDNPEATINVYTPDPDDPHDVGEVKHVWIEV